jgi:agmatine deiminase
MGNKNYRYPAEWEKHQATWLNWPCNLETWKQQDLPKVQHQYLLFIKEIANGEEVHINVNSFHDDMFIMAELSLLKANIDNIHIHHFGNNDAWMRDCGPEFLINSKTNEKQLLNWSYNAWGGKYPPFENDNAIPEKVANHLNISMDTIDFVLEGGAIDTNGEGVLLTTTSCLLNPNRNPNYTQEQIESLLKEKYNLNKVIWLGDGIEGDDTDGHVDDITRFVNKDTVITVVTDDETDTNYKPLQDNLELLKNENLKVIELPMPKKKLFFEGERLPASYANFYICNSAVIVPTFEDENDTKALEIIQKCFPDRKVVGIDSQKIIIGLGSFHCLSKQEPAL